MAVSDFKMHVEDSFKPVHGIYNHTSGTCEIESDESFAIGPVHCAGIHHQPCMLEQHVGEGFRCHACGAYVNPCKIG